MVVDGWIDGWAAHRPDHPAVEFDGKVLNYRQLAKEIAVLAGSLAARGVCAGDRIAFIGLNRPEFLILVFAAARLGAAVVPLNNRLTVVELAYQMAESEPVLAFGADGFANQISAAAPGLDVHDLDDGPLRGGEPQPPSWADPEATLLIVYTSGTTGTPRGAMLSQRAVQATALHGLHLHDLTSSDRSLCFLPLFHVGGLNIQCLPTLYAGGTVILQRRFDPTETLDLIEFAHPTLSLAVPATMAALIDHSRWPSTDLSSLRGLQTGSSVVPTALIQPWFARGVEVGQVYGATETGPTAIYLRHREGQDHIGSCGRPGLHVQVRLVELGEHDAVSGDEVEAAGAPGEIWLRGPNLFSGYWRQPEATLAAHSKDGWYRTGDLAHRDKDGWYFIDDRIRDVVISGGENVYPAEVEAVLAGCPGVAEVAVVGRPDSRWGDVPVAFVVRQLGSDVRASDIADFLNGSLARFKHPHAVHFVDALPRTALGKVKKFELR